MSVIQIATIGESVTVQSVGWLGDWKGFQAVCSTYALRWNKLRGAESRNTGSADSLPGIIKDFSARGFTVQLCEESKARVGQAAKTGLTSQEEVARVRVAEREAEFAKRGLALWTPFQTDGAIFLGSRDRALIGDEVGTGKTIQILTALPAGASVIVVCPASVMVNWCREILKWRPDLAPVLVRRKTSARQARALDRDGIRLEPALKWPGRAQIWVTNYENLPLVEEIHNADPAHPVDYYRRHLIGDEIHRVKNRKARMSQRWALLSDAVKSMKGVLWGATGTPMFNRPPDLANVLKAVHSFNDVFPSWKDFTRRMGGFESGFGLDWTGVIDPTVATSMQRVMIRREKKDVMPYLPPVTYRDVPVDTTAAFDRVCDDLLSGLEKRLVDIDALKAELTRKGESDESLATKVYEVFKETIPFEALSRLHAMVSEIGYVGAIDMIEDYEEQEVPLVVFCWHKGPVQELGKRPGWTYIDGDVDMVERATRIEDFQQGKYKGIALTYAGSTGITLNRAWTMIFLSESWNPSDNVQAVGRVHRGTQTRGVVVNRLHPDHPLVRRMRELLTWKTKMTDVAISAASLVDALADERKKVAEAAVNVIEDPERAKMAAEGLRPAQRVDVSKLLPLIPAGRYALDSAPDAAGKTHTVFWHLDKPETGRWVKFAFLKLQQGPDAGRYSTIRSDQWATPAAASVLERLAVDPLGAAKRYGREIGCCSVCGLALTSEESREIGIGPVCLAKFGGGA